MPATPIRLEVKEGKVVRIEGDQKGTRQLRDIVEKVKDADNFAEIGIGLNPKCRQNGKFEEEKKRIGNVHVAVGRNTGGYGGTIACMVHLDMVVYEATIKTDKDALLQDGENTRAVTLWGTLPGWIAFSAVLAASALVCFLGFIWFMKSKKAFADVI